MRSRGAGIMPGIADIVPGHPGNMPASLIGADLVVTGNIEGPGTIEVQGRVEGDIACAALVQGEASWIAGAIRCDSATLAGRVEGQVEVRMLVIASSARITGDVSYENLSVAQGGVIDGRFMAASAQLLLTDEVGEDRAGESWAGEDGAGEDRAGEGADTGAGSAAA